jgi:hypothetical protein
MQKTMRFCTARLAGIIGLSVAFLSPRLAPAAVPAGTETIVMIRHGEKPAPDPRGQLSCQGLNRSLALPAVLARYGRPTAIFAPNPAVETSEGNPFPGAARYSYVRPLATIEPYAVSESMPVNLRIGAKDIHALQQEVLKPEFANALVVIAWEHLEARQFAEGMLKTFGHGDIVPRWLNADYETIYVFRISTSPNGQRSLAFSVEHENIKDLPKSCPKVALPDTPPPETRPAVTQPPSQVPPPA